MAEDWQAGGFGLYVHWPFCLSKCPYCDFNSHVAATIDQAAWGRAYLAEIDRVGALTKGRLLQSIFFGGGTPSLMDAELVAAIIDRARRWWPTVNDVEITLEANPTSVEAGRFRGYRDGGVTRVSMGIQALNDADLRALGRLHSADEAMRAFDVARGVFDRVSFDLIYARQNQTLEAWRAELKQALGLAIDHLSLYQLTIEEGTAFGDRYNAGKLRGLPDQDLAADMYEATQDICEAAGMPAYEVSNHARLGAESRHNQIYWRYGDYVGIGPGAHGRLTLGGTRHATEAERSPARWMQLVDQRGHGDIVYEPLTDTDALTEFLLMGLRLREGVDLGRLDALGGGVFDNNINGLIDIEMLERADGRLRLTPAGRPVLNAVLRGVLGG